MFRFPGDAKKSEKQNVLPTQLPATTSTTTKTIELEDNCAAKIGDFAIDPEPIKCELKSVEHIPKEVPVGINPSETIQPQFTSPLRETHIFTPIKGEIAVSREISAVGLESATTPVIADSITVKEYRDVEYDPSRFLGLPGTEGNSVVDEFGEFKAGDCVPEVDVKNAVVKEETLRAQVVNNVDKGGKLDGGGGHQFSIDADEEDDFTDFQSVPVAATDFTQSQPQLRSTRVGSSTSAGSSSSTNLTSCLPPISANPLQVLSVNNLSSMVTANREGTAQETILMPSILMSKPMMGSSSVFGGDQEIGKSELDRIEEMFSSQNRASIKGSSPVRVQQHQPQGQSQEEDEWTDFVSVTESKATKSGTAVNNNSSADDDWTDFVSNTTSTGPNFTPWGAPSPSYQTPLGNRPMTTHLPTRGVGGPEMQFVDPTPFFISSAGAGLQSMFGGGGGMGQGVMGNGSRNNANNTGRK